MAQNTVDATAVDITLDEAKGVLGKQVRVQEVQFARADALTRVALAETAALGTLVGFLMSQGIRPGSLAIGAIGFGAVSSFVALLVFALLAGGHHTRRALAIGPDVDVLVDAVAEQGARSEEVQLSLIRTYAGLLAENTRHLERRSRLIAVGLSAMTTAGVMLLASILFIAGGTIHV